jgi:hypothetical protein
MTRRKIGITYPVADKSLAQLTSFQLIFHSREEVVVRRGQIRRIGWVIKTLETQIGQFLLGWKCPVSHFLPGRAKDLSTHLYSLSLQYVCHILTDSLLVLVQLHLKTEERKKERMKSIGKQEQSFLLFLLSPYLLTFMLATQWKLMAFEWMNINLYKDRY